MQGWKDFSELLVHILRLIFECRWLFFGGSGCVGGLSQVLEGQCCTFAEQCFDFLLGCLIIVVIGVSRLNLLFLGSWLLFVFKGMLGSLIFEAQLLGAYSWSLICDA